MFLFYLLYPRNMNIPKIKTVTYFPSSPYPEEFPYLKKKKKINYGRKQKWISEVKA